VTSEKKQLATPNWPEDYPYGVDAYYCLTATSGRRVNLDMRWMDLETNCGSEDCDYIKVRNAVVRSKETTVVLLCCVRKVKLNRKLIVFSYSFFLGL
jgi:hypothetical protein